MEQVLLERSSHRLRERIVVGAASHLAIYLDYPVKGVVAHAVGALNAPIGRVVFILNVAGDVGTIDILLLGGLFRTPPSRSLRVP